MVFRLRILCFSLLAVAASFSATAHGSPLRVLTYNIHHSEGIDGVYNLNRIAGVITAANPDLVALQELDQGNLRSGVNVFQLNQLAQLTGMQGFFGKTINYQGGEYGNGVLVKSDLHVTGMVNRPLPSPVGGEARGIMEVGVSLDGANAAEFGFFATHFTAHNDPASRLAQAGFINSLVAGSTSPTLLAGDLNDTAASPAMQRLFEQWQDSTHLPDPGINRATQIDYVLFRGDAWNVVDGGRFIVDPTTRVASDHFPVLTVIDLAAVPEPSRLALLLAGAAALRCFAGWAARRSRGGGTQAVGI